MAGEAWKWKRLRAGRSRRMDVRLFAVLNPRGCSASRMLASDHERSPWKKSKSTRGCDGSRGGRALAAAGEHRSLTPERWLPRHGRDQPFDRLASASGLFRKTSRRRTRAPTRISLAACWALAGCWLRSQPFWPRLRRWMRAHVARSSRRRFCAADWLGSHHLGFAAGCRCRIFPARPACCKA